MTTIAIVPQIGRSSEKTYRAIAGALHSEGRTAGQALDALTSQLGEPQETTLVIMQPSYPAPFFSQDQQQRLQDLMGRWRQARDAHASLNPQEQAELEKLVEMELHAAKDRARALVDATTLKPILAQARFPKPG